VVGVAGLICSMLGLAVGARWTGWVLPLVISIFNLGMAVRIGRQLYTRS
jgi:hypothetical protein